MMHFVAKLPHKVLGEVIILQEVRVGPFRRMIDSLRRMSEAMISQPYTYESSRKIFGLPLLSINMGPSLPDGSLRQARGIISLGTVASGGIAIGLLSAKGILAVAPIALGIFAVGVGGLGILSVAVVGLGAVSVSVFAFGYFAVGIQAIGIKAVGIAAIGLESVGIIALGKAPRALL